MTMKNLQAYFCYGTFVILKNGLDIPLQLNILHSHSTHTKSKILSLTLSIDKKHFCCSIQYIIFDSECKSVFTRDSK